MQLLKSEDKELLIVWIKSLNEGIEENCVNLSDIDLTKTQKSVTNCSDSVYSEVSNCHEIWSFEVDLAKSENIDTRSAPHPLTKKGGYPHPTRK